MRGSSGHRRVHASQRLWLEQWVLLSRGHWRRDEAGGAIRSAGWRESGDRDLAASSHPAHQPPLWHRALAAAMDTIAPRSPNSWPRAPGTCSSASAARASLKFLYQR